MKLRIQKIDHIDETHAKKMFGWEDDPFYRGPCKGPDDHPQENDWQELQAKLNISPAHRFGIYDSEELVGEFILYSITKKY